MRIIYPQLFILFLLFHVTPSTASECTWNNNKSHVELQQCLQQEYHETDQKLTAMYHKILLLDKKNVEEVKKLSNVPPPDLSTKLTTSYQNFIKYRNSTCDYIRDSYFTGTGVSTAYLQCSINMTLEYIKIINDKSTNRDG